MKFFLLNILFVTIIWSLPFKERTFKFRKKILPTYQLQTGQIAKFVLDEEILSNSYIDDIRLVYGNQQVPYVIRTVNIEATQKKGSNIPIVLKKDDFEAKTLYILRLPELPPNTVYSSLEIDADSKFEAEVSLMGQKELDKEMSWNYEKIYRIDSSLNNGVKNQVSFIKPDRYLFAKVEIKGPKLAYELFMRANYIPVVYSKEISKKISLDKIRFEQNDDKASSVYYIPNPNKIPFLKLRLDFSEKNFNRRYTIYEFNPHEKEYSYFQEGKLERKMNSLEPLEILFTRETRNLLKLEIQYADSPPLNLTSLELVYAQQVLVFDVSQEVFENFDSLFVYYGNPYIKAPNFDPSSINYLFTESTKEIYTSVGKQELNPNFEYSITEPPISIWIMRILFYIGLLVFVFLGYKVLGKYGKSIAHNV